MPNEAQQVTGTRVTHTAFRPSAGSVARHVGRKRPNAPAPELNVRHADHGRGYTTIASNMNEGAMKKKTNNSFIDSFKKALIALVSVVGLSSVITVAGESTTQESIALPNGFSGEIIEIHLPNDWNGKAAVRETHCREDQATGSFLIISSPQINLDFCYGATINVFEGDTDLYMTYQEPWNNDTVPPPEGGSLICSSTFGGTADEYCNGCFVGLCIFGADGVWRNYAYVSSGPSDYCITVERYVCWPTEIIFSDGFESGDLIEWIVVHR